VAEEVKRESVGEGVGAVIVDPAEGEGVVAAAGDARWKPILHDQAATNQRTGNGNVCAHAVLRAIGMVARKRRAVNSSLPIDPADANANEAVFLDYPLTETEKLIYDERTVKEGGYLCTGLDIWITHEPCVMCAMAILHSRFERVVFGRRMPGTGALTAEEDRGLGYGLFWLPALNWRMLGWEWVDDDCATEEGDVGNIHA
jgi:tRNA-specific adenosine deaminase 3